MDEIIKSGIKVKNDLETDFPNSTDAKWGFYKGREVAIIRYENVENARSLGKVAGDEQTKFIEIVDKNIAHGPKVEKTKCRGLKSNRYGFNNKLTKINNTNLLLERTLLLNKSSLNENPEINLYERICVRREPLYSDYLIHGNLVILGEPLMKDYGQGQVIESSEKTLEFLDKVISLLPKKN